MAYRSGLLLFLLFSACVLSSSAQSFVTDIVVPGSPSEVAVNPNNNRIYVSLDTATGPAVGVIDGSTNTVIDTVATAAARALAVNLVTGRIYTIGCCDVIVIDGTTDTVIATIHITDNGSIGLQGITVNPVTNRIYVMDDSNLQMVAIDGNTNTILSRESTNRQELLGMATDFATNEILAAASGNQLVAVNGSTGAITRYTVGSIDQNVAVNSFTSRAYVTNTAGQQSLGVVNLVSGKTGNIPLQGTPFAVCADYLSNLVFTTVSNQTIAKIDGKTNTQTGRVVVSGNYIDVNPATRLVYATDGSGGQVVHVISE